ncbi:ABC transporter permease [Roseicitreum antarcticum]|uniref:Osmoprotectant transport system permease protein n=1 Tax=Roseicitreum antarcticum TaxID=564137 RepID=A0A1H2TCA0_9RHOB|nr:ABC transporter permease [Roseicitreum antarcticum]SDW41576.1 osmoprotectant transport system permease protein [Roseicitreum antarcticum]
MFSRGGGGAVSSISAPGILFAALGAVALLAPFMTLAANRIVAGEGVLAWRVAGLSATGPGVAAVVVGLVLGLPAGLALLRFAGAVLGLAGLLWLLMQGAPVLLDGAGDYARVSPAMGFWCLLVIFMLLMADALAGLAPGPWARAGLLAGVLGALALVLWSGALADLSVLQEYASRRDAFVRATGRHLGLAFGSLAAAAAIGFPLGIWCHRRARLRQTMLPVLSFLQTIPSLAMFGLMIPILGWVGASVPGAQAIGIAGIGFAPAFLALVLYALLPVVGNTVAGLGAAPPAALEAARGMGMTPRQRLWRIELPLGLPVILTGLRIVLVQNIGLAVIAGLIGGGGFGSFVFQGLNQTATDLILLGALPTVALALSAAIVMDILVDLTRPTPEHVP